MITRSKLTIIPAIDIKAGRAVRLHQGQQDAVTDYGDPLEKAREFQTAGARWLHVVDLDAAFGVGENRAIVESIVKETDISVEISGGIRDSTAVERALETGAKRVVLGTAAIEDPEWGKSMISRFGDRIVIGLDLRNGHVATRGWTQTEGEAEFFIEQFDESGCSTYMVTDISKDGTLSGPNLDLLSKIARSTRATIIASGGIASLGDISAIRELVPIGVESAIVGKALYEGAFTVAEACDVAEAM